MKARDFDKKFDAGEDVTKYLDLTKAKRPATNRNGSMSISRYG